MTPVTNSVRFHSTKGLLMCGLLRRSLSSQRCVVLMHGLGGSAFSMSSVVEKLVDRNTAVLTFNNRGSGVVTRLSKKTKAKGRIEYGGSAHEVFTDCIDDIDGAIRFAKRQGAKEIYLAGHSTGCQKSVYWAAKGGRKVKGIILLAPVSDYAAGIKQYGKSKVVRATKYASRLMRRGQKHELLPLSVWPELIDAQRFLSLYTPESVEEIFPYKLKNKRPVLIEKVKIPMLTLWAAKDEYSDMPAKQVVKWFTQHVKAPRSRACSISRAGHGFKRVESEVVRHIRDFIRDCNN